VAPERTRSLAYLALRASSSRVLRLIESELARQGGVATIYTDQLEICGSRRVYRPAMAEIHALGLAEITRFLKRYVCKPSDGWRTVTERDARIISITAREHCNDVRGCHAGHVNAAAAT
jgi:hypothetical protein